MIESQVTYEVNLLLAKKSKISYIIQGYDTGLEKLTNANRSSRFKAIGNFRELHGNYRSAISGLTETTNWAFPRSRKLPIGSFRNDQPFPDIR